MKRSLIVTLFLLVCFSGCSTLKKAFERKKKDEPIVEKEKVPPKLMAPIVKRVWVEPKIEGDRYIDGHFVYVIERSSQWTR